MLTIIVIIASFFGVAALVGGVAVMFRGDATNVVEDRLDILAGVKSATLGRARQRSWSPACCRRRWTRRGA